MGSFPETYNDPVKVKLLILREPCTSTGSELFSSFYNALTPPNLYG